MQDHKNKFFETVLFCFGTITTLIAEKYYRIARRHEFLRKKKHSEAV